MPKCHSCSVSKEIKRGKYKNVPFERTPCAKCTLEEPSHHGRTHVSRDSSGAVEVDEALHAQTEYVYMSKHMEKLASFVTQLMSLPAIERDVVAFRFAYPDRPLKEIAKQHGISVQGIHGRLKRALKRFPVLREVIKMRTGGKE